MNVVALWSGGKDSAYAYLLAKQQSHKVLSLLTLMLNKEKSNFHLIHSDLIDAQAKATGVAIFKKITTPQTYEIDFKTALTDLKTKGAQGLITGDICEAIGHESGWLDRICKEVGLTPIKPLWLGNTNQIYLNYLKTGLKATVVRTNKNLSIDWLGRTLDHSFYTDIQKHPEIDPCGEGGEYHTLITDGPDFKQKIQLIETEKKRLDNGSGYLEIKKWKVTQK
ncbi:MAG: diphthine--ammonia ligase [Nitrososphaerota archaeon]|jgi:uncharacterized protein (TIGR00290 family)|nr:diphthine--ammonia ligase [Nitrososphaerota archaeon]